MSGICHLFARPWWPQLRAALLALHVVGVLVLSLPGPGKLGDPVRWRSQRTQREIELWAARLGQMGWSLTAAELERRLWGITERYLSVRRWLALPFEPYADFAGVAQTWGMFKAPPRELFSLSIEVREAGAWRAVYASRSSEHDYLRSKLDHNRLRKQVGRIDHDDQLFVDLSNWLATRVLLDHPEADAVRFLVEGHPSMAPEDVRTGSLAVKRVIKRRVVSRPGVR